MVKSNFKAVYLKNTQLINNVIGTYFIKGISLIIGFFTMPAYMRYFEDSAILGVWFTIVSLLQWILTFDLGIGNGLRNKLVPALVKNDEKTIKKYISSAYIMIGKISLFTIIAGVVLISMQNWNIILKVPCDLISNDVLKLVVKIVFIGIVIQFFLQLITSILFAMQKTALANSISLISSLIVLFYVLIFKTGNAQKDLINLSIVNVLSVNVPLFIITIIIFLKKLRKQVPSIKYYDRKYANSILKLGGVFFAIQLALLFINSTNEILITRIYGSKYVVEYQIYNKLFYFVVTLFVLIVNPIWSDVTKSYINKQYKRIIKLNKILPVIVLFITICNIILVAVSQNIINIWLPGNGVNVNYIYALVFVCFSAISMMNTALSCFANGLGLLKCQTSCFIIAAIVKIPLVIILSYFIESWISVVIANTIILLPYSIIQTKILKRFYKSKLMENKK